MKFIFILFSFITLVSYPEIFAQDKRNLARSEQFLKDVPDSIQLNSRYKTSIEVGTSFMTNLKGGYGTKNYISPRLSYLPSGPLRFDFNAILGSVNFNKMSLYDYYNGSYLMSGVNPYFGIAGQVTYDMNKKLYISSGGFAEKMPLLESVSLQNKMNYGGSLLVGYRFTDKFSMQAGIEIQRYTNPLNVNPFMYNHGFIP